MEREYASKGVAGSGLGLGIADIIMDTDDAEHVRGTRTVWDEMKAHIDAWSMDVREKIDRVERNR